ncbi:60S ribosomal protein L6 [Clavulina sp. PMI_390]|nr:60S ribosomal protein L6 [Clavulina sp. PMI_390]
MARTTTKPRASTRRGFKSVEPAAAAQQPHKEVKVGGDKNGSTRLVPASRASRYYPADDVLPPKKSKKTATTTPLRSTITPGTVLILLAGRFRGKRVVFLKQLESGLLLVTGPYKVNGVPLRRVNAAYVIATSTKVPLSGSVAEKVTDAFFAKEAKGPKVSAEAEFFEEGKPKAKAAYPEAKASEQKEVDSSIVEAIKKEESLAKYLKSSFGLSKGQFPHQMQF